MMAKADVTTTSIFVRDNNLQSLVFPPPNIYKYNAL